MSVLAMDYAYFSSLKKPYVSLQIRVECKWTDRRTQVKVQEYG